MEGGLPKTFTLLSMNFGILLPTFTGQSSSEYGSSSCSPEVLAVIFRIDW